ncbi:hypothetical protein C2E23DRAFT_733938 [Lenzites betulinus]|nr:hypothetical protein C2E23DRAFT_733938 [Lenzites betulinus]
MDTLPLELHAQIFTFACTDDGSTARSLALVSHYVHEVAAPYRYQSLAISGLGQMSELVSRLDTTPPHLRRVRSLFLSDWTHAQTRESTIRMSEDAQDRYLLEKTLALRILTLAAPTLETLAVVVACPYTGPPLLGALFSTPMPRLKDLSVHGFYPFPHAVGVMPRLERLHLSGNRNPHGLLELGALDAACPSLMDLRVSGLVAAASFAEELRSALRERITDTSTFIPSPASSLPPSLRHVTVQARHAPPLPKRKGTAPRGMQLMHDKMLTALRELEAGGDLEGSVRVSVLEGDQDEDCYALLKREWTLAV